MKAIAENGIDRMIGELQDGMRTVTELPHGGYLFLEHDVPFLLIYRKKEDDKATLRLARTGASYLIMGEDNFQFFAEFVNHLTEKMSARFGSFILMEIYSGEESSSEFIIRGPSHKLPVSLEVLRNQLEKVESRKYGVQLSARIEQTKLRQQENKEALFSIEEIRECGERLSVLKSLLFLGMLTEPCIRCFSENSGKVSRKPSKNRFLNLYAYKHPVNWPVITPSENGKSTRKSSKWTNG